MVGSIKAKNNIQLETRSLALVWGLGGKEDQTTGFLNDQETKQWCFKKKKFCFLAELGKMSVCKVKCKKIIKSQSFSLKSETPQEQESLVKISHFTKYLCYIINSSAECPKRRKKDFK